MLCKNREKKLCFEKVFYFMPRSKITIFFIYHDLTCIVRDFNAITFGIKKKSKLVDKLARHQVGPRKQSGSKRSPIADHARERCYGREVSCGNNLFFESIYIYTKLHYKL